MAGLTGGEALQRYLEQMAGDLAKAEGLKAGFLEGSTYPDGTSVPMVAAVNEFGGSIDIPEHTREVHFKYIKRTGQVSHRFVKAEKATFSQTVTVPAHTITVPARPFFRNMLAEKSPAWGSDLAKHLKASDYDAGEALERMGDQIREQLQASITNFTSPGNAPSTVKKKGFDKPLTDTGDMKQAVGFEVTGS